MLRLSIKAQPLLPLHDQDPPVLSPLLRFPSLRPWSLSPLSSPLPSASLWLPSKPTKSRRWPLRSSRRSPSSRAATRLVSPRRGTTSSAVTPAGTASVLPARVFRGPLILSRKTLALRSSPKSRASSPRCIPTLTRSRSILIRPTHPRWWAPTRLRRSRTLFPGPRLSTRRRSSVSSSAWSATPPLTPSPPMSSSCPGRICTPRKSPCTRSGSFPRPPQTPCRRTTSLPRAWSRSRVTMRDAHFECPRWAWVTRRGYHYLTYFTAPPPTLS